MDMYKSIVQYLKHADDLESCCVCYITGWKSLGGIIIAVFVDQCLSTKLHPEILSSNIVTVGRIQPCKLICKFFTP